MSITFDNDVEIKKSGIVYNGNRNAIKEAYEAGDKDFAGELAISLIELILCGYIPSDNYMVKIALGNMVEMAAINRERYKQRIENDENIKFENNHYEWIANLVNEGLTHKEITDKYNMEFKENISRSTITRRISDIKCDYPDLLLGADVHSVQVGATPAHPGNNCIGAVGAKCAGTDTDTVTDTVTDTATDTDTNTVTSFTSEHSEHSDAEEKSDYERQKELAEYNDEKQALLEADLSYYESRQERYECEDFVDDIPSDDEDNLFDD